MELAPWRCNVFPTKLFIWRRVSFVGKSFTPYFINEFSRQKYIIAQSLQNNPRRNYFIARCIIFWARDRSSQFISENYWATKSNYITQSRAPYSSTPSLSFSFRSASFHCRGFVLLLQISESESGFPFFL